MCRYLVQIGQLLFLWAHLSAYLKGRFIHSFRVYISSSSLVSSVIFVLLVWSVASGYLSYGLFSGPGEALFVFEVKYTRFECIFTSFPLVSSVVLGFARGPCCFWFKLVLQYLSENLGPYIHLCA
jgi:hypothetical protein